MASEAKAMADGRISRRDTWGDLVEDYDEMFLPFSSAVAAMALGSMNLRPGDRFLDVAAGTGAMTLVAAELGSRVTAVDRSAGMLQALRSKLDRPETVSTHVMDGSALELGDRTFDNAGSNMGIVLFDDPLRGLSEMRRVLVEGGRAVVTVVARPRSSPLMQTVMTSLESVSPTPRGHEAPSFEPLSTETALASALSSAGYRNVEVKTETVPWRVDDPGAFFHRWATVAPPVVAIFEGLPRDVLRRAGREFVRIVGESHSERPVVFPTEVLIGLGSR